MICTTIDFISSFVLIRRRKNNDGLVFTLDIYPSLSIFVVDKSYIVAYFKRKFLFAVDNVDRKKTSLLHPSIKMNPYSNLKESDHFTFPFLLKLVSSSVESVGSCEQSVENTGASEKTFSCFFFASDLDPGFEGRV